MAANGYISYLILVLFAVARAASSTVRRRNLTNVVARQFILPSRIQQMSLTDNRLSGNDPSGMTFRGLPSATSEVTAQQVEDQINQLNRLSQGLRALPQSLDKEQMAKGQQNPFSTYVQQANRLTPETGFGRPMGPDSGYAKSIARNPLTGPNGLTKDVLADLMFGNLKSLAAAGGLTNFNNQMEENELIPQTLGNSDLGAFNSPLLDGRLGKSPLGKAGIGFPLPPNENVDFNDLPSNDLGDLKDLPNIHTRHHTKGGRKKKPRKSDVVTKLLLSLLVDKLKDIYEMDKINRTQDKSYKMRMDSTTIGKIEKTLKEHNHREKSKNKTENAGERDTKVMENFDSNLSFPLTISDQKGSRMSLVDSSQSGGKDDNSSISVDTRNIENIIKGIENGNLDSKKNDSENSADSGNSPQEISQKTTKTFSSTDPSLFNTGSSSEFHRVKIESNGVLGKSGTIPTVSDYHPTIDTKTTDPNQGIFDVQTDKATVSALPTFSISSILNQEVPGNVKGNNRVLDENNSLKEVKTESIGLGVSPSAKEPIKTSALDDKTDSSTSTGEGNTVNYLEASRVLGAVFNKVRDPLARKSVEVAIKAMLKLMKSDNAYSKKQSLPSVEKLMKSDSAYSKKQTVPSVKKSQILHEKVRQLMRTIQQLSKAVDEETRVTSNEKRHQWGTKHKISHSHHRHKSHHTHHEQNKHSKH